MSSMARHIFLGETEDIKIDDSQQTVKASVEEVDPDSS